MKKIKLYYCIHCHNVAWKAHNAGPALVCCETEMQELEANTVDASKEKHVPVITVEGSNVTVKIGSEPHPMIPEHHIAIVALQTSDTEVQFKQLVAGDDPAATFVVKDPNGQIAAFAWCNLHGLWLSEK